MRNYTLSNHLLLDEGEHTLTILVNTALLTTVDTATVYLEEIRIDGGQINIMPQDMTFDEGEGVNALDESDPPMATNTISSSGALKGKFTI